MWCLCLQRRLSSKSPAINVPMEVRAEKALDAIMNCCVGASFLEEEDVPHLSLILTTVFPTADKAEINRIVASRVGGDEDSSLEEEEGSEEEVELVEDKANSSRWAAQ